MKKLTKLIASTLVVVSVIALNPIGVSAKLIGDSRYGWRYKEGDSWATGWRLIDMDTSIGSKKWFYFDSNGYMKHDTRVDGYYLSSNGAWNENSSSNINNTANHDYDEARKKGEKLNYVPSSGEVSYNPSEGIKNLTDLYKLKWYENPTRQVTKGEFMLLQLRTINASLKRQNRDKLTIISDKKFNFNDKDTLCEAAQEEMKIFNSMGILTADQYGNMNLDNSIKRDEATKMVAQIDSFLRIGMLNDSNDTNSDSDSTIKLEEILQILDKEVGDYERYQITRADIAKAMNETFKVTSNLYIATIEVTDSAKMPSNAEIYPYIVSTVDKSVYEKPMKCQFPNYFLNPSELYVYKKGEMSLVKQKIESFYNTVFNVDYATINAEEFKQKLQYGYCGTIDNYSNNKIDEYVEYVKANKIKTTGEVQFQEPILYFDAGSYRARTKITFNIIQSNTRGNLFVFDFVTNWHNTYNNDSYLIYADLPLGNAILDPNNYMYIVFPIFSACIVDKETSGITTTVGY